MIKLKDNCYLDSQPYDYQMARTKELFSLHQAKFTPELRKALIEILEEGPHYHVCHRESTSGAVEHVLQVRFPRRFLELMSTIGTYDIW